MHKLHYVYIGKKLPQYAKAALELAAEYGGVELVFLGSLELKKSLKNSPVNFIEIESFYDKTEFLGLEGRFQLPEGFRGGFWLKTLERFYVLDQYMQKFDIHEIFHAELDQLLFRVDILKENLSSTGKVGFFLPLHTGDLACASIFFCNSREVLREFIEFTNSSKTIPSEMELLAQWAKNNSQKIFIMPSLATELKPTFFKKHFPGNILKQSDLGGIIDPLQIGPWVGGNDPRNETLLHKPKTKFFELSLDESLLSSLELKKIKLAYNESSKLLKLLFDGSPSFNLYNLHFHAKLHKWLLKSKNPVTRLLEIANSEVPVSIKDSRIEQIKYRSSYFYKESFFAIRKNPKKVFLIPFLGIKNLKYFVKIFFVSLNVRLKRKPSSAPFLSGDTFRSIAKHVFEPETEFIEINSINSGDIIFCQSDLIREFNEKVLSKLQCEVTLILGNSDQNFNTLNTAELNLSEVKKVYAQNLEEQIYKFHVLPIGLENAWRMDNGIPLAFKLHRLIKLKKLPRIMWTFSPTNKVERNDAAIALTQCKSADNLGRISKFKHRTALSRYSFVASPPGNGLDCHRTWEAMYLNCVPIIKRSFMTAEFERLGLPVWVVDSYDEIINYDQKSLESKYEEIKPKFNSEWLWISIWRKNIASNSN